MNPKTNDKKSLKLYEQVKLKILQIIKEREIKPYEPVPSEGELADLCGVSRMTSKLALLALAKEGIVYRLPRKGTFLENIDIKSIQTHEEINYKTKYIALVVPEIDDFIGSIIIAVVNSAKKNNYQVVIQITENDFEREELVLREIAKNSDIQGILLFPADRIKAGDELLKLKISKYPIVILDRGFNEIDFDSVYHDHFNGAYQITKYLINHGHSDIGFVSDHLGVVKSREERYQGYIQALIDSKIKVNIENILLVKNLFLGQHFSITEDPMVSDMAVFLKQAKHMTAVFCSDDFLAMKLIYAAQSLRMQIPDQLSIVGFSDSKEVIYSPIPLTTIHQPIQPIGEQAVQLLMERIMNREEEVKSVKVEVSITERKSVQRKTI